MVPGAFRRKQAGLTTNTEKTMSYDNEMTDRAVRAFCTRSARTGSPTQPSAHLSRREGDIVTLANVNGTLARYQVSRDKQRAERVRFID